MVPVNDPVRRRLGLDRKSALIIDENSYSRKIIADICYSLDLGSALTAKSGERGLAALKAKRFDLMILDGAPPDWLEFVALVRASDNESIKSIPIILLKAQAKPSDVAAAREAGVTEFLTRPFSAQMLLDRVVRIFSTPRDFVNTQPLSVRVGDRMAMPAGKC